MCVCKGKTSPLTGGPVHVHVVVAGGVLVYNATARVNGRTSVVALALGAEAVRAGLGHGS
jgi:hypothetical protein